MIYKKQSSDATLQIPVLSHSLEAAISVGASKKGSSDLRVMYTMSDFRIGSRTIDKGVLGINIATLRD